MDEVVHHFTLDGDGVDLMEAAAVGLEVRDNVGCRELRVVCIGVLQFLVPRLVNDCMKDIDDAIVVGIV